MYEFPYGGEQQLNLNWIINEIITLHKRLDPDYELPNFDNAFPYMNLNQLNLDWILRELKAIKDLAPTEDSQLLKMVANALIANTYDAETQYNVDDIVYRDSDNRLYKCITATPAGGEPFDSSKWVEVDVGGVLTDLLNSVVIPPEPYDSTPAMDGTASAGTSTQYARGDHVHPKDTARVPTSRTVNGKALSGNITLNASDIPNDSNVSGDNTDDALNILNNEISNNQLNVATVESGLTATRNYGVGDFVIVNGRLRRVIASILNGDTFVSGTNIATTELASEMQMKEYQGSIDPDFATMGADSFYLRCYTYFHTFGIVWLSFYTPAVTPNTTITIGHFSADCKPAGIYSITWTGQKGGTYMITFASSGDVTLYCTDATPQAQFVRCYIPLLVNS